MAAAEEVEIQVPWGIMSLKCWNSRDSFPVLVTHGLCENAAAFDRLIPRLSQNFFYVVLDLPGHGRSSPFPPGLPLDFVNYLTQLQRVVNYFRWKKLSLMGHSLGAHLAEFFAAAFPEKVEKLILIDATAPSPISREIFLVFHFNQMNEVLKREQNNTSPTIYTYEEALKQVMERRLSKLAPEAAENMLTRCLKKSPTGFVFTTDPRARREIKPAISEDVILDQLQRIKCPVLVVLAKDSEQSLLLNSPGFYSTVLHILATTNPGSSVVRVPGNHCVHNNHPEIIAPVVNQFLSQQKSKF